MEKEAYLFFKKSYWLVITDFRIIIRDKTNTEEKRTIPYGRLKGITKSTVENPKAFILHVKMEQDEGIFCYKMDEMCDLIKRVYAQLTKKNLPIFHVPSKDLKAYVTKEKDALLEICRMPLRKFRVMSERLLEDNDSSDDDEEEKELFSEFVMVDKAEADKIDQYLRKFNKPELL